jgi:transcription-repair coupling factor (superfamily II helicase)
MALAGFRDTSIIATPPPGRRPIETTLCAFDEVAVAGAVRAELARGGQVFYVVPRVEAFPEKMARLARLVPEARVRSAHGRMPAGSLETVFDAFGDKQFDVLLCTTIVESGLDLPNVNTIVVEDVNLLGLASLYQLRGRVGRSTLQAYALLMWDAASELSDDSRQRLDAIRDSAGLLGQGFRIAERDMAIRGVGAVFGDKQSGDLAGVGVDLYLEMLYEQLQSVEAQGIPPVAWDDVDLSAMSLRGAVPPGLVASQAEARALEARASEAGRSGPAALKALAAQVEQATGALLPRQLHSLLRAHLLRWYAAELGVHALSSPSPGLLDMRTAMSERTFGCLEPLLPDADRAGLAWAPGRITLRTTVLPGEQAAWVSSPAGC